MIRDDLGAKVMQLHVVTSNSAGRVYSAGLSGKAGLLDETIAVLQRVAAGNSPDSVRAAVVDSDLLGKATYENRRSVWDKIHQRYLKDWPGAMRLARLVKDSADRNSTSLLIYYEFCRSEPILYDAITGPVYARFAAGFSGVEIGDLQVWLDRAANDHPEVQRWSPQTRKKVLSNILTVMRDFGLMMGTARKMFQAIYLPLVVFGYVLYRIYDTPHPPGPRGIAGSPDWRLFFQDEDDITGLLSEATAVGFCTFKRQGDVMTVDLTWPNLEAYVAAVTRQVR